jgi:DNA polymerase III delta subunit
VAERGTRIEQDAEDALIEFMGDDQEMIANEIDKLSLTRDTASITKEDIESHSIPSDEGIVWRMTDLLCEGKRKPALLYAHRMIDRGGDAYGLWALLLSTLKNLVLIHAALRSGVRSPGEIASKTGIHPFALRSLLPFASRLTPAQVSAFLAWSVQSDKDLKTGKYRATDEAPEEIRVLIDQFILHCP